jgi:hypothetical protein
VKVDGRMLIVKGDRQVKVGNATESKQFNRELTLPEFVDAKTLQSYLADDGQLTMEAPVLMDRVYNDAGSSAITSSNTFRQSSPGRIVDTTFTGGRQPSNLGIGNNQSSSYSSSFRQESNNSGSGGSSNFHRNSPLRDHLLVIVEIIKLLLHFQLSHHDQNFLIVNEMMEQKMSHINLI